MDKITFQLASIHDRELIKKWWTKPHVVEFWDNSPKAWENVEHYLQGKKHLFDYWIASIDNVPFSLLMTSDASEGISPNHPNFPWLEPQGLTITIDFMIGEENFLGKGLSYRTLKEFSDFIRDKDVSAILIDPAIDNKKAIHVYQRAGFEIISTFTRDSGYFSGTKHYMMKRKLREKNGL